MDPFIHYWDVNVDKVTTLHFLSTFLGHPTAADNLTQNFSCLVNEEMQKKKKVGSNLPGWPWCQLEVLGRLTHEFDK